MKHLILMYEWALAQRLACLTLVLFAMSFIVSYSTPARIAPVQTIKSSSHKQALSDLPLLAATAVQSDIPTIQSQSDVSATAGITRQYSKLPLSFEVNQGQTDKEVRFLSRGPGYSLFLTSTEAVLTLREPAPDAALSHDESAREGAPYRSVLSPHLASAKVGPKGATGGSIAPKGDAFSAPTLRMRLVGINRKPTITGLNALPGKANYLRGKDRSRWRTAIPTYGRVEYDDVYPGIDLIYYGTQRQLEYDFVVAPRTDPGRILLAFAGAEKSSIDANGDLILEVAGRTIRLRKPLAYQELPGGKQQVKADFAVKGESIGFRVGSYDPTLPLVIDPVLTYSTYLGGSESDTPTGVALDSSGNAFVIGYTSSLDFPTTSGVMQEEKYPSTVSYSPDIFVAKVSNTGDTLVYATYLGGSGRDAGFGIAVDGAGNAYLTGSTNSNDFPTTAGAFDTIFVPSGRIAEDIFASDQAFVAKLSDNGQALIYSTYLGALDGGDVATGIAVDGSGSAYITGRTGYTTQQFPTTPGAFQTTLDLTRTQGAAAWVAKLDAAGSTLLYSTYLSGSVYTTSSGIAVDGQGNAYVSGSTRSQDFPTTAGALQTSAPAGGAFVSKLNATGSGLLYSTFLGGARGGYISGIAIDASGNAYVAGQTVAPDFPTTEGAFDRSCGTDGTCNDDNNPYTELNPDAFVAKLDPNASGAESLVYATFLGGAKGDGGSGIAVDAFGNAYVTGSTQSDDFPTAFPLQPEIGGDRDGFVAKLNATGSALIYSTYLGGGSYDGLGRVALDASNDLYVVGSTFSADFPTSNALQPVPGGTDGFGDGVVAKITARGRAISMTAVRVGEQLTYTLSVTNFGPGDATEVALTDTLPPGVSLVSATATQGSCTGTSTVICQLGTLADSTSVTVTIVVQVLAGGQIVNTATVSGAGLDPIKTDDAATTTILIATQADLGVTHGFAHDPVVPPGDRLAYALNVTNNGPDPVSGVRVNDQLPVGVTFVQANPSQGSCSGTDTVTCDLGTLASGATAVVNVSAKPPNVGKRFTNTASVTASYNVDPDPSNNTTTSTVTCPSCPELGIANIEVTQGLQFLGDPDWRTFPDNSVPLIRGKRTLVRVYFETNPPSDSMTTFKFSGITGAVSLFRCGETVPISGLTGNGPLNIPSYPDSPVLFSQEAQRGLDGSLNHTLNFNLISPLPTCMDLEVTLTSPGATGYLVLKTKRIYGLRFEDVPPLKLRLYNVMSLGNQFSSGPRPADRALLYGWLRNAYPISKLQVEEESFFGAIGAILPESWTCGHIDTSLTLTKWLNEVGGEDPRFRYYAMINADHLGFRRGLAFDTRVSCGPAGTPGLGNGFGWDQDLSYGDWYGAHEIGHTHTLSHVDAATTTGVKDEPGPNPNYPHADGRISPPSNSLWGVDWRGVSKVLKPVIVGTQSDEFMSYGVNQWISDYSYKIIKNVIQMESNPVVGTFSFGGAPGEHLAVFGLVNETQGTVELNSFFRLPDMLPVQPRTPGPFSLQLLDNAANVLADYPFTPHPVEENQGGNADQLLAITELVPYDPATARIAVLRNGVIVAERLVSPNPPVVTMASPLGGETLQGNSVRVEWQASDADGDGLTTQLFFSADGGKTWSLLAADLTTTQVDLDISRLRGTDQGLFMALVSDGVNTGRAVTPESFVVPRKAPEVVIPVRDDIVIKTGEMLMLDGLGLDPEDGLLDSNALEWTSDRDGPLSTDSPLMTGRLSEGTHHLTLTATDSDGNRVSTSVNAIVTSGVNAPPTANAGPDQTVEATSSSGANVTLNGTASSDPDGDALTYTWTGDFGTAPAATPAITLPLGTHAITLTVSDGKGGASSDTVTINVQYPFTGFFQPVDNLPALNVVKAGAGIPVKFSLNRDWGLAIFTTGSPSSQKIACDTALPTDSIEETVTAGASGLNFDQLTNTYNYVWKTNKEWANSCRQLMLQLNDGTTHQANFKFMK